MVRDHVAKTITWIDPNTFLSTPPPTARPSAPRPPCHIQQHRIQVDDGVLLCAEFHDDDERRSQAVPFSITHDTIHLRLCDCRCEEAAHIELAAVLCDAATDGRRRRRTL